MLGEKLPVQERQLDSVGDLLDLGVEAADVLVGDVRDLLEDEVLDLGAGQLLEQQARAGVHEQRVAGPQLLAVEASASSTTRSSSARPTMIARCPSSSTSFMVTTSPGRPRCPRAITTFSDSLSTTSCPRLQLGRPQARVQRDPHLAAAREDVGRPVVVATQEGPVRSRRLGQLVDLFAQRGDVLAGLTQGVGQPLVLGERLLELALGLQEPLLQGAYPLGGVRQAPAEGRDLLFERCDLPFERTCLGAAAPQVHARGQRCGSPEAQP